MLMLRRSQTPAAAEEQAFERFAIEVRAVAMALARSHRLAVDGSAMLDLGDARQAEFGLLGLSAAAKQHLRRGEDLLTLVERIVAMLDAGIRRPAEPSRIDAGLHLLRAIAMAELLQEEAARYRRDARLRELADSSIARLADAFVMRFGGRLPNDVGRVFPRFATAVQRVPPWVSTAFGAVA